MDDDFMDISDLSDNYEDDSDREPLATSFQYNIDSYTNAIPVARLVDDFNEGIIKVPDFQRPYVWNREDRRSGRHRPSLFIDSILLGLPIPPISLYKELNAREHSYLIDGRQRLVTLSAFKKGCFDDKQEFVLKGESISRDWLEKSYEKLSDKLKSRFDRAYIPVMYIRQLTEDLEKTPGASSIYLLFDRLNSGGYALKPHEKRGVLGVQNPCVLEIIKEIYILKGWERVLPSTLLDYVKKPYNKSQVEEIIFRAVAFALDFEKYNGNITRFLDSFMLSYQLTGKKSILDKTALSLQTLVDNNQIDKYFKPQGKFSISLFESIFVGVYRAGGKINKFKNKYIKFVKSEMYLPQGKRSLSTKGDVISKFKKAIEIFNE